MGISGILTRNFGDLLDGKCGLGGESEAAERHSHRRGSNFMSFSSRNFTNILKGVHQRKLPYLLICLIEGEEESQINFCTFFFLI